MGGKFWKERQTGPTPPTKKKIFFARVSPVSIFGEGKHATQHMWVSEWVIEQGWSGGGVLRLGAGCGGKSRGKGGGGDRMMEAGYGKRGRQEDRPTRHPRKHLSYFRTKSVLEETPARDDG